MDQDILKSSLPRLQLVLTGVLNRILHAPPAQGSVGRQPHILCTPVQVSCKKKDLNDIYSQHFTQPYFKRGVIYKSNMILKNYHYLFKYMFTCLRDLKLVNSCLELNSYVIWAKLLFRVGFLYVIWTNACWHKNISILNHSCKIYYKIYCVDIITLFARNSSRVLHGIVLCVYHNRNSFCPVLLINVEQRRPIDLCHVAPKSSNDALRYTILRPHLERKQKFEPRASNRPLLIRLRHVWDMKSFYHILFYFFYFFLNIT